MATTDTTVWTLDDLIDLDRYPIDRPDCPAYAAAVAQARTELRADGCAIVRDLVRGEAVRRLDDEIVLRKHTTHYSTDVINPYFHTSRSPDVPDRHTLNTFIERSSGFIPGNS